jgi:hypothetical protein
VTVEPPDNMRGTGMAPFQARALYVYGVTSGQKVYLFSNIHA